MPMLIIKRLDNENIDKAIRRYKRKRQKIKLRHELNRRKSYTKPSILRRAEIISAVYRDEKFGD